MYSEDYITRLFVFIDNLLKTLQELEICKQLPKWKPYMGLNCMVYVIC